MSEWRTVALAKLGTIYDGPHATPTRQESGKYFLNISSLVEGRLDLSHSDRVDDEDFAKWTRRVQPRAGDLLFSYETRLGDAALMPDGVDACLGRRMALIRPHKNVVDSRYLLYAWLSPWFKTEIQARAIHGATVSRISLKELGQWPFKLPPLDAQRAIGEVLGALDDKIAANHRLRGMLNSTASALVQDTARNAEMTALGSVCSVITRGIAPKYADEGLRVLNQKCVRDSTLELNPSRWTSTSPRVEEKFLIEGDVLINSTGQGTLGRVGRWIGFSEPATVDSHVSIARVDPEVADPAYVGSFLLGMEKQIEYLAEGSTGQTELRRDHLSSLEVRLPSLEIQRAVGERIRVFDARSAAARDENTALARTRDELLPLLMSGRITVKDAEGVVEDAV